MSVGVHKRHQCYEKGSQGNVGLWVFMGPKREGCGGTSGKR